MRHVRRLKIGLLFLILALAIYGVIAVISYFVAKYVNISSEAATRIISGVGLLIILAYFLGFLFTRVVDGKDDS